MPEPSWRAADRRRPDEPCSTRSSAPTCAAAAAPASTATSSGEACRNAPLKGRAHLWSATPTRASRAPSRTACCWASHADLVFDGMTSPPRDRRRKGFIYLRGEYRYLLDPWRTPCWPAPRAEPAGRDILGRGFDFDIEIHLGAGAYICGEESALIESLEGKRGQAAQPPALPGHQRLPRPADHGEQRRDLRRRALIALNGGDWYAGIGTPQSAGTKILSVSGDCERPGHLRVPLRRHRRQVLETAARTTRRRCRSAGRPASAVGRRVRPPHRLRGRRRRRRLHHLRWPPRHVRGGAQLTHFFAARELRLLHAVPGRHSLLNEPDGQARRTGAVRPTISPRSRSLQPAAARR
jgi:hypothetical protein